MTSKSETLAVLVLACVGVIKFVEGALTFLPPNTTYVNVGTSITLACHITPLTARITFEKGGMSVGTCTVPIPGLLPGMCTPPAIIQNISTENTTWTFTNADFSTLNGSWNCIHNAERGTIQIQVTEIASVLHTNEATISSNIDKNTKFEVTVNCSYPKPDILWTLQTCNGSSISINVSNNPTVVENPSNCVSPRKEYSSTIKVSDMASPPEKMCYKAKATLSYSYTSSISISSSFSKNIIIEGPATTTVHEPTTQLYTADTTSYLMETTNSATSSTVTSWLSANKYYIVGACVGAVVLLLSITGVCCFHQKRRDKNSLSESKLRFEVHTSSKSSSLDDNSKSHFNTGNDLNNDRCTDKINTYTTDHL